VLLNTAVVADSDPRSREDLSKRFESAGFFVATCSGSTGLLQLVASGPSPEILIVDQTILDSCGNFSFAESGQQLPLIVVVSDCPSFDQALTAGQRRADLYLPKPILDIDIVLSRARLRRDTRPDNKARDQAQGRLDDWLPLSLERMRWEYVTFVLSRCGSIRKASALLCVPRRTLQRFLARPAPPLRPPPNGTSSISD
jgi:ActR/RegA family two-component response regulator